MVETISNSMGYEGFIEAYNSVAEAIESKIAAGENPIEFYGQMAGLLEANIGNAITLRQEELGEGSVVPSEDILREVISLNILRIQGGEFDRATRELMDLAQEHPQMQAEINTTLDDYGIEYTPRRFWQMWAVVEQTPLSEEENAAQSAFDQRLTALSEIIAGGGEGVIDARTQIAEMLLDESNAQLARRSFGVSSQDQISQYALTMLGDNVANGDAPSALAVSELQDDFAENPSLLGLVQHILEFFGVEITEGTNGQPSTATITQPRGPEDDAAAPAQLAEQAPEEPAAPAQEEVVTPQPAAGDQTPPQAAPAVEITPEVQPTPQPAQEAPAQAAPETPQPTATETQEPPTQTSPEPTATEPEPTQQDPLLNPDDILNVEELIDGHGVEADGTYSDRNLLIDAIQKVRDITGDDTLHQGLLNRLTENNVFVQSADSQAALQAYGAAYRSAISDGQPLTRSEYGAMLGAMLDTIEESPNSVVPDRAGIADDVKAYDRSQAPAVAADIAAIKTSMGG